MKSKRSLFKLALVFICAVILAISTICITQNAYAYSTLPTGNNAIANIYKVNGKFSKDKLDALAQKAGYTGVDEMVTAAEGGEIKTSEDFGDTVVNFGSYTFGGTTHELTWIPAYLSNSDDGPVLTLWLADVADTNGTLSDQEISTFSNGTYSTSATGQQWNGSTIYSNTYDGSYIRNYVLNGSNSYATAWGSGTPISAPVPSTMTKFTQFTTGSLASYIVKPSAVTWQKTAGRMKNDPEWNASDATGTGANYPSAWLNDNLWLPSVYEIYDNTITANSTATNFSENGGLWYTGNSSNTGKRTSSFPYWLRSGFSNNRNLVYSVNSTNGRNVGDPVYVALGVRPALHLNLAMANDNSEPDHTHSFGEWEVTKAPTCSAKGEEQRVCSVEDCPLTDSKETREIAIDPTAHSYGDWVVTTAATCTAPGEETKTCSYNSAHKETRPVTPTGHNYSEDWSSNDTKHWHICANNCGIKDSEEDHTWDSGTVTEQPSCTKTGKKLLTCTTCQKTKTEDVPKSEHTYSSEWKYDATNHWHECSVCNAVQPNSTVAHSGGTADCENKKQCSICHQEYGEYGAHTPETIPAEDPDCTTKGKTEGSKCSVCQEILTAQSEINALGHDFSITLSGTQPTCQQGGKATMKCSRCEETQEQNSADPVDHIYTNYVSDGNATCTANGTKTAACDFGCGTENTITDEGSATGHTPGDAATCTEPQTCEVCGTELAPALGHTPEVDEAKVPTCTDTGLTAGAHCSVCDTVLTEQEEVPALGHSYEWVITKEATTEETGLMENICTVCQNKDGEQEIAKLEDPNGEIDLPVDIHVEFKVTQSSTDNDYSDIEKGLKRGYWAQLWYRNDDGTLGDEFTDQINCFLTLKIPTDIIEAIRGGEEINRDKIAAGLKVYYIDGDGLPVEVDNFTIAMRDDDSWQIKFNYNEKFRAEVVFAADLTEQPAPEPETGIPWWVWLIVGISIVVIIILIVVIAIAAKNKKNGGGTPGDNGEVLSQLAEQGEKIDELLGRDDGGFNTLVELDENGNVIFK